RALPAQRRMEVPRGRPGLRLRPRRDRHGLRRRHLTSPAAGRAAGPGLSRIPLPGGSGITRHDREGSGPNMGVSLAKGGNVSLTKAAPNLTAVTVGLGWDVRATTGADFDLDASALMLAGNGKVISDQHFVFYNNLRSPDGSVEHTGDNLTGEGEGDDESINVDLTAVPPQCERIVFPVSIYDADNRQQSFGQVRNAFIRIVNRTDGNELAR